MVCSHCRLGGDLNQLGVSLREQGSADDANEAFDRADSVHAQCVGCDCQHMTGTTALKWPWVHVEGRPE